MQARVLLPALICVSAALVGVSAVPVCDDIATNVILDSTKNVADGEIWLKVARSMIDDAEQWSLSDSAASPLRRAIKEMEMLLNATAKSMNVPRPFTYDAKLTRAQRGWPSNVGRKTKVYTRRVVDRIHFNQARRLLTRLKNYGRSFAERLQTIQRNNPLGSFIRRPRPGQAIGFDTITRLPIESRLLPQGLTINSRVGLATFQRMSDQFAHLLKRGWKPALTAAGIGAVTLTGWKVIEELQSLPESDTLNDILEVLIEESQNTANFAHIYNLNLNKSYEDRKVELLVMMLRLDMGSFTEMGKELQEDIRADTRSIAEAQRGNISYAAADKSLWDDIKQTQYVSANWTPEVYGAKAEYVKDKDMITIWAPMDCSK